MSRITNFLKSAAAYLVIFLTVLLAFFMVFKGFLQAPDFVRWLGHWHPVVLHVPIVMIPVTIIQYWRKDKAFHWFLTFSTLATLVAALTGMLLSLESESAGNLLSTHQWLGVGMSAFMVFWYFLRADSNRSITIFLQGVLVMGIVVTGHLGGQITHGEGFLSLSGQGQEYIEKAMPEDPKVFDDVVMPVLEKRCANCHNENKSKGKLRLDSYANVLKGGKTAKGIDLQDFKNGELYKRISLPTDKKHHMPPKDETQLSKDELAVLIQWLELGADDTTKYSQLAGDGELHQLISAKIQHQQMQKWTDLPEVDDDVLADLSDEYCRILRMYGKSDALQVLIFPHDRYTPKLLAGLKKISQNIVELNLHGLPLGEKEIETISSFVNLERLDISQSPIDSRIFEKLQPLTRLISIKAYDTGLDGQALQKLDQYPALKTVYLFNTQVKDEEVENFASQHDALKLIKNAPESMNFHSSLPVPVIKPGRHFFREPYYVHFDHPLKSIGIRYTLDGSLPTVESPLVPDSLKIEEETHLKFFAELAGWEPSPVDSADFWKAGLTPSKYSLQYPPDKKYPGKGKSLLFDLVKGPDNYSDSAWMAFREQPMVLTCQFDAPTVIHQVMLSSVLHTDPYIFPPKNIKVYAIAPSGNARLIRSVAPAQPKDRRSRSSLYLRIALPEQQVSALRIEVSPVDKLPVWHRGKGEPGWFFIDEVVLQ